MQFIKTFLTFVLGAVVYGQSIIALLPTGINPIYSATNSNTGKAYISNLNGHTVTIIRPDNTTVNVTAGNGPGKIVINELTNKVYVENENDGTLTVIDGATDTVAATVSGLGSGLVGIAVNPVTNVIAVVAEFSGQVSFIDGATNTVTRILPVLFPEQISVNLTNNRWYVANENNNSVTVIDGTPDSGGGGGGGGGCGTGGTTVPQSSFTPSNFYPTAGSSFTLTFSLTGPNCGVVTFTDANVQIGTGSVNTQGVATFTYTIPAGHHSFKAQFGGNTIYAPKTSSTLWIND